MITVSGVSSMMTSTPVAVSKARMFRPSRPMIRPFISSLGSGTAATVRLGGVLRGEPLDGHRDDRGAPRGRRPSGPAP